MSINQLDHADDIHPRILFEAKAQLAHPLFILFDTSLGVKKLSVDWCTANIFPIYKKGDKKEPLNYRPISLTSIICKVLESIIRDLIITHFVRNDIFSKQQYGFLKRRNTVIQLIKMFDQWSDSLFSIVAFKTLTDISQGSVATHLRCGGIFSDNAITNFLLILTVIGF